MTCNEFEILLADSLDGTLAAEVKDNFERHQHSCPACAELAHDAGSVVTFLNHVPDVVPPPAMAQRIIAATSTSGGSSRHWLRQWFGSRTAFVFQPRFAMGLIVALLSIAIAARFWTGAGIGAQRAWERTVMGYENMQVVYEVQSQLQDQLQEWMNGRVEAPDGEKQ